MTSIQTIHREYDELIKASPQKSKEAILHLKESLIKTGCRFAKEPIPCFLKPYFLSNAETAELENVIFHLMNMLEKVIKTFFSVPELRPIFGLPRKAQELMRIDPGYKRSIIIARPDAFFNGKTFRFVEFNCDSPAGAGYADVQEGIFKDTFLMRDLGKHYRWKKTKRLEKLLHALLACYKEFGGSKTPPHIAIADWGNMRTHDEFLIVKRYFEVRGYPCIVCDPRKLKLKQEKLTVDGFRVDIVYRRAIFGELWQKREQVKDFLRAYALGKVCVVNPLRSRLAANKAALSILTNPIYNGLFSSEEINIRETHVPWTRRVLDTNKVYNGRKVVLKHMIETRRNDFVLKPADSYGGKNVNIGLETHPALWKKILNRILAGRRDWVVQEYVDIPEMTVPVIKNGSAAIVSKKVNINPFVFNGRYAGSMARLSDERVINVSAGGGLIPVVSYQKKKAI